MGAETGMTSEIVRRIDLSIPAGSDVKAILGELSALATGKGLRALAVLDRRDDGRRVRVELVGPADAIADILEPPRWRGPAPHTPRVRGVVLKGGHARIMRDEVLAPAGTPDQYPDPAPLGRIGVPWDLTASPPGAVGRAPDEDVIVAIVDSGIMTHHEDVKGRLVHGTSVIGGGIEDEDGHGTLLAGTVLEASNRSVKLMTVKFIDGRIRPHGGNAAKAIRWAVEHGAHVIDLSWELGIESPQYELRDAVKYARVKGVLVVVAAGNSGANNDERPAFPACFGHKKCQVLPGAALDNVITVMATDDFDDTPGFSNYGDTSVHIAAPGMRIISTQSYLSARPSELVSYQRYDGTSPAAAYVAGAAALLKSKNPTMSPKTIRDVLIETADRRPDLRCEAHGRLNVSRALAWVEAPGAVASPPAPSRQRGGSSQPP